jgi:lipopolysaccharide/colanic/teichoic acid biosynthesis glycosyltransferase
MSPWLRFRVVLDRALAAAASIVFAPVIGVLAYLVHRDDGGPGLITVPRVGRDGATFGMWKIRSMRAESPSGHATGSGLTSDRDGRITPIGRRIRALHLDELPQLFNVVAGQMTLLGPRPEAPRYVQRDDERWQQVLRVPPGIAGPTQLIVGDWEREVISRETGEADYRSEVIPVKLAIDDWYLRSATPRLDLLVSATLLRRAALGGDGKRLQSTVLERVESAEMPITWARIRSM